MIEQQRVQRAWPALIGAVAIAGALGFGLAHWLAKRNAPMPAAVSAPATADPAQIAGPVEVKIPAQYLSLAKIAVEPIGGGGLRAEILTSGTVTAPPNSEAMIVARASGNVTRVNRQLGDSVRAGETLALVDSTEATAMTADRNVATAKADLARKTYARESSLFRQGVTPRQDMEAAQAALAVAESAAKRASAVAKAAQVGKDGKSIAVVSPINGKITAAMAMLGGFVQPHTELFRIAGDGPAQVKVALPASDIGRVRPGDQATIVAASGAAVAATVRSVTPTVSASTRAATVILTPSSSVRDLIVGEGVQARLHLKNGASGMVVPEDAVQNVDGHDVLFIRTKDGFLAQPVLVGTRSGGLAQIISGVKAGQQVATRNAFLIKADMIKSAGDE